MAAAGSGVALASHWYESSALANLLGADVALADIYTLYRCPDRLLEHKHKPACSITWWGARRDLFNVSLDVCCFEAQQRGRLGIVLGI
jgi:hypothetical protein